MNIFQQDAQEREEHLALLKQQDRMFSPMRNSTITAKGCITNVQFDESELDDLEGWGKIIKIDSNFVEWRSPTYNPPAPKKKSNRGRKKKAKKKTNRKVQGTGRCMNSQIMFSILGTHIRRIPDTPDKHSEVTIKVDETHEQLTKPYVFLLFRNGNFTLPGVLTEDMSDVREPINELCLYLSDMFGKVELEYIETSMCNYKFWMEGRMIELLKLQTYCSDHFTHLLNIHFRHVKEYLIERVNPEEAHIDYGEFHRFLSNSKPPKNLFVNFTKLRNAIEEYSLIEHYAKLTEINSLIYANFHIDLTDAMIKRIWGYYLDNFLLSLEETLRKDKDNHMSHIKYDQEKYPGFIIKIKTPTKKKPEKKTTIKLFMSGKIDIDGANNRKEADYIYWWLNDLFARNRDLSYNPEDPSDDEDDEYSWTDSEE